VSSSTAHSVFFLNAYCLFWLILTLPVSSSHHHKCLENNKVWRTMIDSLIAKRLLSMLCVDEVHLFVQFRLTFRQEFAQLQSALFKKLRVKASPSADPSRAHTSVPVLFMTATCNKTMLDQIELLSGLRFDCSNNIFWSTADTMKHRNVCVRVSYTSYPLTSFKKLVGPALQGSRLQKFIWYANNCVTIKRHTETLGMWIDSQGFQSDIVSVTGAQMKEQKFHHTNIFAATNLPNLALLATSDDAPRDHSIPRC
jgi:superfamily II DNA helicase RecQ